MIRVGQLAHPDRPDGSDNDAPQPKEQSAGDEQAGIRCACGEASSREAEHSAKKQTPSSTEPVRDTGDEHHAHDIS